MNVKTRQVPPAPKMTEAHCWPVSCDHCVFQELGGRHYCLLHSMQVKNMGAVRCQEWEERPE